VRRPVLRARLISRRACRWRCRAPFTAGRPAAPAVQEVVGFRLTKARRLDQPELKAQATRSR
jgi:hypothetical protein